MHSDYNTGLASSGNGGAVAPVRSVNSWLFRSDPIHDRTDH
jgi:hypothetical protein